MKNNSVGSAQLKDNAVTSTSLASGVITTDKINSNAQITKTQLASDVQTSLTKADGAMTQSVADARYASAWQPGVAFTAGFVIQTPLGIAMARKTSGVSASTWTADLTNWVAADSGRAWNVQDFGAKGDSTADDTAAIQAAINAASVAIPTSLGLGSAVTGGVVYFPKGWYKVTATLTTPSHGVELRGASRTSSVIFAGSTFPQNNPMVVSTNDTGANTTQFCSRLNRITLHCNDIPGSVGWVTTTGQEGCGLIDARIRQYRDCGIRISAPTTSADYAAEIICLDSELWGSYAGSNYGVDIASAVGAIYVERTTILSLAPTGTNTHLAAIRNNNGRLFARSLHLEDYADGVLTLGGGISQVDGVVAYNGVGESTGHAVISFDNGNGCGTFTSVYAGTGNAIYCPRFSLTRGSGYYNRFTVNPSTNQYYWPDTVLGNLDLTGQSTSTARPTIRIRNINARNEFVIARFEDADANPTFTVGANGMATIGRSGVTQWDHGHAILADYHLWVDLDGVLRYKSGAPASDKDGLSIPSTLAVKSGRYCVPPMTQGSVAIAVGSLRVHRVRLGKATTFDRAGLYCATGVADSVVRVGIYAQGTDGMPAALIADLGTISTAAAGNSTLTISQTLPAGTYWVGGVSQGTSAPTVNAHTGAAEGMTVASPSDAAINVAGYEMTSVSGALPATFTTTPTPIASAHRVLLRVV